MEKLYQVFVSSTYEDLREARDTVMEVLLESECMPAGMELFPASNEDRWSLIRRVIDGCDYYLIIVAGRYGSMNDDGISYTEAEYDYAVATKKPIMRFLYGDIQELRGRLLESDPEARQKLEGFREKLKADKICKFWSTPGELGGLVSRSLNYLKSNYPAEGWVRAGQVATPELLRENAELRESVAQLRLEIERGKAAPIDTVLLAQGSQVASFQSVLRYLDSKDRPQARTIVVTRTWDDLFRDLGPSMVNEASESSLVAKFQSGLIRAIPVTRIPDIQTALGIQTTGETTFDRVKLQFMALGLIVTSQKRRAVYDTDTYWTLTDRGQAYLLSLTAIRTEEGPELIEGTSE